MKRIIKLIVNAGVDETLDILQRAELRTLNRISLYVLFIAVAMTFCMTYFVQNHAWFILTVSFVELLLLASVLALNSVQRFAFAKQVFIFNTSFIILLLVGYYGISSNYHYIAPISFLCLLYLFREGSRSDFYTILANLTMCLGGVLFVYLTDFSIVQLNPEELRGSRLGAYISATMVTISIGSILFVNSRHRFEITRKHLQHLSGRSKMLTSISENLDEGLFKASSSNGLEIVNDSFVKIFGYRSQEEMVKVNPVLIYDDLQQRDDILDTINKVGSVHNLLVKYRKKNGTLFYGRLSCNKILETGQDKIVGIVTDVTHEQEQNDRIQQSERRLKEAQRIAKLGDFRLFDNHNKAPFWSEEALRIHGFETNEKTPDLQIIAGSLSQVSYEDFKNQCEHAKKTQKAVEFGDWYTDTKGIKKYLKYKIRFVDHVEGQNKNHWIGTVQDISESKKMEDEMEGNTRFFQHSLNQAPLEVALLDSDFKYTFLSEQAVTNKDIRNWLVGKTDFDYCEYRQKPISLAKTRYSYLSQCKETQTVVRWEEEIADSYGRINYYFRNVVPITDPVSGRIYYAGFGFNVTRLRESQVSLEKKNEELNKVNQELDRFVYSISHDLRAPVASVLGLISLAEEAPKLEDTKEVLKMQREALDRLDLYIRDVIDYSRNKRLTPISKRLVLSEIVENSLTNLAYLPTIGQIEFFHEYEQGDHVWSDQMRVRIVVNNLLSNAIKYLDPKKDHPYIRIATSRQKNGLTVIVQDNGVGINPDYEERVWEMFYRGTSDSSGSGLGLYILQESLAALEGTVELETEFGKGTKFTVFIPDAE
jgi:PAS domain S-box-containing protein